MKRFVSILILLSILTHAWGQVTVIPGKTVSGDTTASASSSSATPSSSPSKKLNYGAQIGTSFGFSPGFGSGMNTYVSPYITYQVSPKFRMKAGFSVINTQLFDYHPLFIQESSSSGYSGNFSSALLYVQGQYQLGTRILLNGTAFKEFPITGDLPGYPAAGYKGISGFSMDVSYKLGEHVFIQAGFNYLNGGHPYYYNPSLPSSPFGGIYSPYGW